jgi:dolichol-phosphate mannosyltransferase
LENRPLKKVLSLVIPTYNERDNIAPLVEKVHASLTGYDYEILFIDDNSRDGTAEAVRALEGKYPVRVVVRLDKRGLASAVVDGIGLAESDVVGVMDADLQHPPEVLPRLLEAVRNGAEIAVASRYIKGGGCVNWGLGRKITSRVAGLIAHFLLPVTGRVHDPMSGCFMLRKSVIAGAALAPTGYKILLEILVRGNYQQVTEVPYLFYTRQKGESKLNTRQGMDYLRHVYSLMNRRRELLRFGQFCLVGGTGVIVNEGILGLLTHFGDLQVYFSSLIAIEASIISNFALNDYFTFGDKHTGRRGSYLSRLLKFNAACAIGAAIQYGLLLLFTYVFGVHYLISNLIGIAVATLWNYTASKLWAWR